MKRVEKTNALSTESSFWFQPEEGLVGELLEFLERYEKRDRYRIPDITLLEPIAGIFHISVTELIWGNAVRNANVSSNMLRSSFYVCPVCGNVIHGMGQAVITCHGIDLKPEEAEQTDEDHKIFVERIEDEYFVSIEHEMTKQHHISFIAALSSDRL